MNIEQQITDLLIENIKREKGYIDYEAVMYYLGIDEAYAKTIANLLTLKELAA